MAVKECKRYANTLNCVFGNTGQSLARRLHARDLGEMPVPQIVFRMVAEEMWLA
jgi:hypothetical protein